MGKHIGRRPRWSPAAALRLLAVAHRSVGATAADSPHAADPSRDPAPASTDTVGHREDAARAGTDHRKTRTLPYIIESRERTINAAILLGAVGLLIILLVPSARSLVADHNDLWTGAFRLATEHIKITGTIALSFAGTMTLKALRRSREK